MIISIKTIVSGRKYAAYLDGELLASAKDIECATCRVLQSRGISGRVTFTAPDSDTPSISGDIDKLAGLTVRETPTEGPRLSKHVPFAGIK